MRTRQAASAQKARAIERVEPCLPLAKIPGTVGDKNQSDCPGLKSLSHILGTNLFIPSSYINGFNFFPFPLCLQPF